MCLVWVWRFELPKGQLLALRLLPSSSPPCSRIFLTCCPRRISAVLVLFSALGVNFQVLPSSASSLRLLRKSVPLAFTSSSSLLTFGFCLLTFSNSEILRSTQGVWVFQMLVFPSLWWCLFFVVVFFNHLGFKEEEQILSHPETPLPFWREPTPRCESAASRVWGRGEAQDFICSSSQFSPDLAEPAPGSRVVNRQRRSALIGQLSLPRPTGLRHAPVTSC